MLSIFRDSYKLPVFDVVKNLFRQVVEAMIYVHDQGVIHRDLALGNIFLTDNTSVVSFILFYCDIHGVLSLYKDYCKRLDKLLNGRKCL